MLGCGAKKVQNSWIHNVFAVRFCAGIEVVTHDFDFKENIECY